MSLAELCRRTQDLDAARRLGQALWMRVGTRLELRDLIWSRGSLGQDGDQVLWASLLECRGIGPGSVLQPEGLCRLLCEICGSRDRADDGHPQLVWTLPTQLASRDDQDSYYRAALEVICAAQQSLWLVSPFLEARGVGRLIEALLLALSRTVSVSIIAHEVGCLGARASVALEDLRRDALGKPGKLTVYTVDEKERLLVHPKIIVADTSVVLLGSANLTENGLAINLEAGVFMRDRRVASEVLQQLTHLLASGIVREAFSPPSS